MDSMNLIHKAKLTMANQLWSQREETVRRNEFEIEIELRADKDECRERLGTSSRSGRIT
jgi:hypothetical protein